MEKKFRKNIKNIIILLIFVLLIILIFSIINVSHRKENILKRLISGINNLNYSYTTDDGKALVKVFGKKAVKKDLIDEENNINNITYIDYEKRNSTIIYPQTKFVEHYNNNGIEDMKYYKDFIEYINKSNYKYIGKNNIKDQKYTIIELTDIVSNKTSSNDQMTSIRIWINDSSDVVEKVEYYIYDRKIDEEYFNFCTGTVSQEDVKLPKNIDTEYSSDTNN